MGTRNLTVVQMDGEYKVAQYGQWDGGPNWQGKTALNFLRSADMNKFKEQLGKCKLKSKFTDKFDKNLDYLFEKVDKVTRIYGYTEKDDKIKEVLTEKQHFSYRCFTRDTAAEILEVIYNAPEKYKSIPLYNNIKFAEDSLFCEWAYVIDLDKNTFEVYKGFNQKPLGKSERFYTKVPTEKYQPVKLVKEYKLDELPTEEEFLDFFKVDEEE